jgi:dethiobiotin synthetase
MRLPEGIQFNMNDAFKKQGLFVAGTDTGVGKTLIAAGLIKLSRSLGIRAVGLKPVETGCDVISGTVFPQDGAFLQAASDNSISLDDCAPLRFSLPAAPARAAAMEGRRIFLSELEEHIRSVTETADLTFIEGAGGLMVPMSDKKLLIDFVRTLGFPVILVARMRLGTINHTLLSVEALQKRGISIEAIIINAIDDGAGPEEEFTPGDLSKLVKNIPIETMRHLSESERSDPQAISGAMLANWSRGFIKTLIKPELFS